MNSVDFLAIGDPVVDEFIRLKDARVTCDINDANCTISMRWGDKIPFESATLVVGVGNAANAAVASARLGLSTALLGIVGNDAEGNDIIETLTKEGLDAAYLSKEDGKTTNHHYVLSFESERTILVKHEAYTYVFPEHLPAPKTLYLSSLADSVSDTYYDAIASFAEKNPEMLFAFQPGTFQMEMGTERLKRIYARTDIFFCNKEEAGRILNTKTTDLKELFTGLHALGPKKVIITDGRNGAYASDGTTSLMVPMYPDVRAPKERTGAGDAFSSTVTIALTKGIPFSEALLWGPVNSMSVVQEVGAQKGLLTSAQMETYLAEAPAAYTVSPL